MEASDVHHGGYEIEREGSGGEQWDHGVVVCSKFI